VGKAAQKIAEIYKATTDKKGTQLVFLDLGTPKAKEKVDATETEASDEEGEETAEEKRLLQNVYRVLKERIVASGIPEKEIAFIHEAKTNKQKERLFERVNSGDVRVIIGSTSKLGTGVNVQERAAALHHLDAPWRPRDIEQREGRIIRQGNKAYGPKMDEDRKVIDVGPGVRVYTYVTERSFDAFMWQAIEAKSRAIKSIMRRENPPRAVEDIDSFTMSAGEAKAIASGNPDIMKAVTLKNDITKLQMLRGSHTDARARARGQLGQLPKEITEIHSTIAKLEKDAALSKVEAPFAIKVGDQPFAERPAAGEALKGIIASAPETTDAARALQIARYKGFDVKVLNQGPGAGYQLLITNPATGYTHATTVIPYSELTGTGALQRIENKVANIPTAVGAAQKRLEQAQENLKTYQAQGEKPFEYQERLDKLSKQLGILERKLQGQEIKSEELATVEDIITPPEGIPEPSPVYRWGKAQPEQAAEEARELVKVEKEALKEIVKPDIATPNVNPVAEAQKPPVEKKIEVEAAPPKAEEPKPLNGYLGFYKDKRFEVYAATSFEAQQKIAQEHKIKNRTQIHVVLAEYGEPPEAKTEVVEVPIAIEKPEVIEVPVAIAAPKVEEVKPTPATKEPWQMTKGEFFDQEWTKRTTSSSPKAEDRLFSSTADEMDIKWRHKNAVQVALKEGKPVPTEVLKDYPELKAKGESPNVLNLTKEAEGKGLKYLNDITDYVKDKVNPQMTHDERTKLKTEVYNALTEIDKGKPTLAAQVTQKLAKELKVEKPTPKVEHPVQPQATEQKEVSMPKTTAVKVGKPRAKRTKHAIDIDKAIRAEEVVSPTNKEGVEKWKEHPERLDVQGIDTPPTKQARKPRIKTEKPKAAKAEPTEHKEPTTYVVSLDDTRSPHAIAIDRGIQAKDVVTRRNKEGVSRWRSHPNQMDVSGVDTRRRKSKPPTRAILDRRGHYHKQKRGSVV
jgi:hypothetical protein